MEQVLYTKIPPGFTSLQMQNILHKQNTLEIMRLIKE